MLERLLIRVGALTGLVACGAPAPTGPDASASVDGAVVDPDAAAPRWTDREIVPLQLEHGAFAAIGEAPNAVVVIPRGYRGGGPLDVVVFLHGWYNCVTNAVGAVNSPCTDGGVARQAYDVAGQLEAAGRQALLLAPELRVDAGSSDPGALAEPGQFGALLDDVMRELGPRLAQDVADLRHVIVAAHSGGYWAAAEILGGGGHDVDEVWLLDGLYGELATFDAWLADPAAAAALQATPPQRRLATIYTAGGGTLANSQAMADRAVAWLGDHMLDDRTTATLLPEAYAVGGLFKRSGLSHDDVPRYYLEQLLATSVLPDPLTP